MAIRTLIALLAASVVLSTMIGFAAAKLSEPDRARADAFQRHVNRVYREVVRTDQPNTLGARVLRTCNAVAPPCD